MGTKSEESMYATVQGVIFDMDGVIVDSHPFHRRAWHKFLRSVGKDVSEEDLDFILDGRKRHEILRHFLGELSEPELANYGNCKDEFFQQVANRSQNQFAASCVLSDISGAMAFWLQWRPREAIAGQNSPSTSSVSCSISR